MGRKEIVLLFALLCFCGGLNAQNDSLFSGEKLYAFDLFDVAGARSIHLPADKSVKHYSVFVFLSPECPLSQGYLPLLNDLSTQYKNEIGFYGIIPGRAYSPETVRAFAATYHVVFPLLIDSSKALSTYLRAKVTPEIVLLDSEDNLVYRGAVDDLLGGLGKRRVKASKEYLKDAISSALQHKPSPVKRTKAVGCTINDY